MPRRPTELSSNDPAGFVCDGGDCPTLQTGASDPAENTRTTPTLVLSWNSTLKLLGSGLTNGAIRGIYRTIQSIKRANSTLD